MPELKPVKQVHCKFYHFFYHLFYHLFTAPLFAGHSRPRSPCPTARENGVPLVPPRFVYFRRVNQDLGRRPVPNPFVHACCPSRVQVTHKIESIGAVTPCPHVRDVVFQIPPLQAHSCGAAALSTLVCFILISPSLIKTTCLRLR